MLCETELVWGSEDLQAQPELGAKQKKKREGKGFEVQDRTRSLSRVSTSVSFLGSATERAWWYMRDLIIKSNCEKHKKDSFFKV